MCHLEFIVRILGICVSPSHDYTRVFSISLLSPDGPLLCLLKTLNGGNYFSGHTLKKPLKLSRIVLWYFWMIWSLLQFLPQALEIRTCVTRGENCSERSKSQLFESLSHSLSHTHTYLSSSVKELGWLTVLSLTLAQCSDARANAIQTATTKLPMERNVLRPINDVTLLPSLTYIHWFNPTLFYFSERPGQQRAPCVVVWYYPAVFCPTVSVVGIDGSWVGDEGNNVSFYYTTTCGRTQKRAAPFISPAISHLRVWGGLSVMCPVLGR